MPVDLLEEGRTDSSRAHQEDSTCQRETASVVTVDSNAAPHSIAVSSNNSTSSSPVQASPVLLPQSSQSRSDESSQDGSQKESRSLNRLSFRRIGVSIFILQLLSTIAFTWYAWATGTSRLEIPTFVVWQVWCLITIWKASMPYAENAYLHRASAVLVLLASNTMFVPDPASPRGRTILALCTTRLIGVMVAVIVMEMSGKCLRQTVFEDQDAFNLLAVTTILTNIKASLVIVFLLADAVGSLANSRTWLDVTKSYEVLQQLEGDDSPYVTSEQKMAEQVFEETVRGFQAVFAGGTLNLTLFISFVLSSIARLSILDVAELKVTFVEGLVGVASLTLIFLTLISLGFLQAHQGADLATLNAFFTSMWLSGFVSVVGCGIIARSISKGCHPYFEQRSERERGEGGPLLLVGG